MAGKGQRNRSQIESKGGGLGQVIVPRRARLGNWGIERSPKICEEKEIVISVSIQKEESRRGGKVRGRNWN